MSATAQAEPVSLPSTAGGPSPRPDPAEGISEIGRRLLTLGSEIERELRGMSALREILGRVNTGVTLDEIAGYIYESFRPLIPYDRIGLALLGEDGNRVTARWARSDVGEIHLGSGYSAPLEGSTLEVILETGEPRVIDDLEAYLEAKPSSDSTRRIVQEGLRSSLTCPLVAVGEPIGFLFFSSRRPGAYRDVHVETFQDIASTLSVIVEKGQVYERLEEVNRELARTVEALRDANARIEEITRTDELTGVANRRALDEALERTISLSRRRDVPLAVVMADLDHFKRINDEHGHPAGDRVLAGFAGILDEESRVEDIVGRWGGEEFLVILPDSDEAAAVSFAERVRRCLAAAGLLESDGVVTASFGVASLRDSDSCDDLLGRVDDRLYEAKEGGRDRVAR